MSPKPNTVNSKGYRSPMEGMILVVSATGRLLGFMTQPPPTEWEIWELMIAPKMSAEAMESVLASKEAEAKVVYQRLELRKRFEQFNAGPERGRWAMKQYECPMGGEKLLWLVPFFVSAGEMFGVRINDDPLTGLGRRG